MAKTALFGGSYHPIHLVHLAIANSAIRRFGIDQLWFIPAKVSPLKRGSMTASDANRIEMLHLAISNDPRFGVSDCELKRGGISYTVDTLIKWHEENPDDELFFIAGMDSLLTLHKWKDWEQIVGLCRFITFMRPGYDMRPDKEALNLPDKTAQRLIDDIFEGELLDISSSEIRSNLQKERGTSLTKLVPPRVADYIIRQRLYTN